jgi:peptidyl-prolyl cis-trans isomerase B (cyclophilin B)
MKILFNVLGIIAAGIFLFSCDSPSRELESLEATEVASEVVEEPVDSALEARVKAMLGIGYPKLNDGNVDAFLTSWANDDLQSDTITLETKHGVIEIELFDDVPLHTANFKYKIHRQYFSPSEFTRVVPEFVIQGGNSEEEKPQQQRFLIGHHSLQAEFSPEHIHTRGVIAMSRGYTNNPEKRSSGYDFYIVTGRRISMVELASIEREKGFKYTEAQKQMYHTIGGAPHLDFEHTVFGRVISGMSVADKIAQTPTDNSDWPLEKLEVVISTNN